MDLKILWVHDEFNGPINGMAIYNDKKVWFKRKNLMSVKNYREATLDGSSFRYLDNDDHDNDDNLYDLYRLPENIIQILEKEHAEYCERTGKPLNHGDITNRNKINIKTATQVDNSSNSLPQSMLEVINFNPKVDPSSVHIAGELIVENINESQFSNYYVPRQIV